MTIVSDILFVECIVYLTFCGLVKYLVFILKLFRFRNKWNTYFFKQVFG